MIKVKVSLSPDKSLGYGYLLRCCDKHQQVHINELEDGQTWLCASCSKPLLYRDGDRFYLIGEEKTI